MAAEAELCSAFGALKDIGFDGCSQQASTPAHHVPSSWVGLSTPPARSAAAPLSLDSWATSAGTSANPSRQASAALPLAAAGSAGSCGLERQGTALSALSDKVASTLGIASLTDLCGASYIPAGRLKKAKAVGEGAFAEVERALLLPDPAADAQQQPDRPHPSPTHSAQPRAVAVKRLKPHVLASEDECLSFIAEARLLVNLGRHPSIIEYIGVGCSADSGCPEEQWRSLFLVQEFAAGGTLKRLILQQMISPTRRLYSTTDAVRWAAEVAEGLAHLHSITPRIVHRDVKAENVLLAKGPGGRLDAKIADFGLHALLPGAAGAGQEAAEWTCFNIKEEASMHGAGEAGLYLNAVATLSGTALAGSLAPGSQAAKAASPASPADGSATARQLLQEERKCNRRYRMTGKTGPFPYMAPEVVLCRPYNEKVDVFSFGVLLFELLHRRLVIAELMHLGDPQAAEAHAYKVAAGYRLPICPTVPPELRRIVEECWDHCPDRRPGMADVAARLCQAEQSLQEQQAEGRAAGAANRVSAGCCTTM